MVEERFTYGSNIYNFRETRGTFEYILQEIFEDIARQDTLMRKGVTLNRRLAINMYYLAPASEYRAIATCLFGVSTSFVCTCIKDVCEAITRRRASVISYR